MRHCLVRTRNEHKLGHCDKVTQGIISQINERNRLIFEIILKCQEGGETAREADSSIDNVKIDLDLVPPRKLARTKSQEKLKVAVKELAS